MEADLRKVARVAVALFVVALAVVVVGLFASGAEKNAQITELRDHGVVVVVTTTGCLGQLGGSGSNAAGYACRGTYVVDGRRYTQNIPGTTRRDPGSTFRAVIVPSDPTLLDTVGAVRSEHASVRVYVLPAILLVTLAGLLLVLGLRRGRLLRRG